MQTEYTVNPNRKEICRKEQMGSAQATIYHQKQQKINQRIKYLPAEIFWYNKAKKIKIKPIKRLSMRLLTNLRSSLIKKLNLCRMMLYLLPKDWIQIKLKKI